MKYSSALIRRAEELVNDPSSGVKNFEDAILLLIESDREEDRKDHAELIDAEIFRRLAP